MLHPLISLLSFMVFAAFVSLGQMSSSLVGLLMLISVWLVSKQPPAPKAWLMIKRLRIFFISIFFMYLWFTPGQLIWPVLDNWSPTYDGLMQGSQRILALVILVLGVESLLRLTDRPSLLTGLYYLATPFKWLGIDRERFIIRVLLTLETAEVQTLTANKTKLDVRAGVNEGANAGTKSDTKAFTNETVDIRHKFEIKNIGQYLERVTERLADSFSLAMNRQVDIQEVEFEIKSLPNWIQWLIPLIMVVVFMNLK